MHSVVGEKKKPHWVSYLHHFSIWKVKMYIFKSADVITAMNNTDQLNSAFLYTCTKSGYLSYACRLK